MTHLVQTFIESAQSNISVPKIPTFGNSHFWERDPSVFEMKTLLQDINNEKQQMEGLKMVIAAMSKGSNVAELFPDVVKLVASHNTEIKKMVYIYLVQYAEIEQNAALLSISILQRNSHDINQMIRAHALRTISSFRVRMLIQVIITTVAGGTKDSSPYVRKTAAHAIPKIFSVDPSQKDALIEYIEILLKDRSPLVLGSAVAAFNEVCPDRFDLIHPNFRKLCEILADVDEWGQTSILNLLTRYGRAHFVDPDKAKDKKEEVPEEEDKDDFMSNFSSFGSVMDLDHEHKYLLESALPLLSSRNAAVVLGVATLYFYLAPNAEKHKVGRALVRIIRSPREQQYCVLSSILAMANSHPEILQPYLSEFFVEASDPTYTRKIKIEIMTLLSNESNIDRILREFTYYTTREEKEFVTGTIQAIGKCAMRLPEMTDRCMSHLMQLLSSKSSAVVAEAVVVIKLLLQMLPAESNHNDEVIKQLTRMFNKVTNPKARASIVWVVGEYLDKVSTFAPDILRQLAKDFINSDETVKLQVLTLSAKLIIKNPEQTALIGQYIFNLARYDSNYDIRDRARFMRHVLFNPQEKLPVLHSYLRSLFITTKPSPVPPNYESRFMVGSLAQTVGHITPCYNALPDWALEIKSAELRKTAEPEPMNHGFRFVSQGFGPDSTLLPEQRQRIGFNIEDEDLEGFLGNTGEDGDYDPEYEGEFGDGYEEEYWEEGYDEEGYGEDGYEGYGGEGTEGGEGTGEGEGEFYEDEYGEYDVGYDDYTGYDTANG